MARKAKKLAGKHDWELFETLYLSGYEVSEILKLPQFACMSAQVARNRVTDRGLAKQRTELRAHAAAVAGSTVSQRMKEEIEQHYDFMLTQLSQERAIMKMRMKNNDLDTQRARLDLLEKYNKQAVQALGLENAAPQDEDINGFKMLVALRLDMKSLNAPEEKSVGDLAVHELQAQAINMPPFDNNVDKVIEADVKDVDVKQKEDYVELPNQHNDKEEESQVGGDIGCNAGSEGLQQQQPITDIKAAAKLFFKTNRRQKKEEDGGIGDTLPPLD